MGVLMVAVGVVGYLMSRRRGPDEVRRFLIWYAMAWPFMAAGLGGVLLPKEHWLYFVQGGIAVVGYGVQFFDARRQRLRADGRRVEGAGTNLEL
jgi:hypothetical protein